jgi:hypothetical protein
LPLVNKVGSRSPRKIRYRVVSIWSFVSLTLNFVVNMTILIVSLTKTPIRTDRYLGKRCARRYPEARGDLYQHSIGAASAKRR